MYLSGKIIFLKSQVIISSFSITNNTPTPPERISNSIYIHIKFNAKLHCRFEKCNIHDSFIEMKCTTACIYNLQRQEQVVHVQYATYVNKVNSGTIILVHAHFIYIINACTSTFLYLLQIPFSAKQINIKTHMNILYQQYRYICTHVPGSYIFIKELYMI